MNLTWLKQWTNSYILVLFSFPVVLIAWSLESLSHVHWINERFMCILSGLEDTAVIKDTHWTETLSCLTGLQLLLQAVPSPALTAWLHRVFDCPWPFSASHSFEELWSSRGLLPSLKLLLSMEIQSFLGCPWP